MFKGLRPVIMKNRNYIAACPSYHSFYCVEQQIMSEQPCQQSQPTAPALNKYNIQHQQAMAKLKQLHCQIGTKFAKLGELKQQFVHLQQKKFVKTFISIMDKLSTELVEATKATETIDKEINADPHCVHLQKELGYFEHHRHSTEQQIKEVKDKILQGFRKNRLIMQEREALHRELYQETARHQKYSSKAKILTMRRTSLPDNVLSNTRPQTATQREKSSASQSMGKRNYSFQQKMSSAKTRQLTKIQTAITQKQSSRPYTKSCRLQ